MRKPFDFEVTSSKEKGTLSGCGNVTTDSASVTIKKCDPMATLDCTDCSLSIETAFAVSKKDKFSAFTETDISTESARK
ncbi:MAG: hypothetical protein ACSHW7_09645 [Patiriisocius sp.]|uniref:hypothetical protein n=1 Tax=Patiriisocius sp. TaxID=2822396 RepID=UPI003EF83EFD